MGRRMTNTCSLHGFGARWMQPHHVVNNWVDKHMQRARWDSITTKSAIGLVGIGTSRSRVSHTPFWPCCGRRPLTCRWKKKRVWPGHRVCRRSRPSAACRPPECAGDPPPALATGLDGRACGILRPQLVVVASRASGRRPTLALPPADGDLSITTTVVLRWQVGRPNAKR